MKKLLCLLLSCALCAVFAACGESSPAAEPTEPEVPETSEAPAEEIVVPEVEEAEPEEDTRGIPGSDYLEIALDLEQNGFPKHTAQTIEDFDCMLISEMHGNMRYSLSYIPLTGKGDAAGQVISGTFSIINGDGLDNATFLAEAENFLAFCASFPYDTADAEAARQWVRDNLQAAGPGAENKQVETTIGDVKFTLYGTTLESGAYGMRELYIEKAAAE